MSDAHEPPATDPAIHRGRTDAHEAPGRDPVRLGARLLARTSGVRGDAERSVDRARRLSSDDDGRAPIAVEACRDALGAYRDALDQSVRELCDGDAGEQRGGPDEPAPPGVDDAPAPARSRVRERIAGGLAAVGVAAVLGLVGWAALPWGSGTAGSVDDEVVAHPALPADGTAIAPRILRSLPAGSPTARMAGEDGVRRVVTAPLPSQGQPGVARPGRLQSRASAAGAASQAPPTRASPPQASSTDSPAAQAPAGGPAGQGGAGQAGADAAASGPSAQSGAAAVDDTAQQATETAQQATEEATQHVDEVVDAVTEQVPEVGRRLEAALLDTSQQPVSGDERAGGDAPGATGNGAAADGDAPGATGGGAAANGAAPGATGDGAAAGGEAHKAGDARRSRPEAGVDAQDDDALLDDDDDLLP
jgi:hypothetical protein